MRPQVMNTKQQLHFSAAVLVRAAAVLVPDPAADLLMVGGFLDELPPEELTASAAGSL